MAVADESVSKLSLVEPRRSALAAGHAPSSKRIVTVIQPRTCLHILSVSELWRHRGLFFRLIWRDIKVRYRQTALGAFWAVAQPLVTMLAFSVFLGKVAASPASGVPYPLFVFAGLVPWLFLANAISKAAESVVNNQTLITRIYFPRIILPLSAVGLGLIDFSVSFVLLIGMMLAYGFVPGLSSLLIPAIILILIATAAGVGAVMAALMVSYRDVRSLLPLIIQVWLFATPNIYLQVGESSSRWRQTLLLLNPAASAIDNLRRSLLGQPLDGRDLALSLAIALLLLLGGVLYFQRFERRFSDII